MSGITHTVTKENKSLARIISIVLLLAAISCFVGWLGHITPLFADDFSYSVSFVTKKADELAVGGARVAKAALHDD